MSDIYHNTVSLKLHNVNMYLPLNINSTLETFFSTIALKKKREKYRSWQAFLQISTRTTSGQIFNHCLKLQTANKQELQHYTTRKLSR